MIKEVNTAHLEAAISSTDDYLTTCVLGQTFRLIIGVRNDRYVAFDSLDGPIMEFCGTGQKIAKLFDEGSRTGDVVMPELRKLLPVEVELYEN